MVPAGIAPVRRAGEHGKVRAVSRERLQIAGKFVMLARFLREEVRRVIAERAADEEHPLRAHCCCFLLRADADRQHRVEKRQTDGNPGSAENSSAVEW